MTRDSIFFVRGGGGRGGDNRNIERWWLSDTIGNVLHWRGNPKHVLLKS